MNNEIWIPACGGTETWTRYRDGREYLYVWWKNAPEGTPANRRHGWLDQTDHITYTCPGEMQ